ncbi:MAG TPA: HD domain-containing phosphohydrolase [Pyrinomonadaceae bacterium]|nr:HD domain-containing phosphohydrolase [Pyrinomonadaceae bacterium]
MDERASLLIVDDEPEVRNVLGDFLGASYVCATAESAEAALALLKAGRFDLIITDIGMSGMSGLEMFPRVREHAPETIIIVVSGEQAIESAVEAMRAGAFDYLTKPFDLKHVELAVGRALDHLSLLRDKRRHESYLEELIGERTVALNRALSSLEDSYRATLKALAAALEMRDTDTRGHSERVVQFSLRLGRELGLSADELRSLEFGALLHDIGKIGVPDAILRKPGCLTEGEWETMRLHPELGQRILCGIEFLEGAARVVAQHHEKWDGSGYPKGLKECEIDLNARIFAVADAFDAMVSDRVYRAGKSYESAAAELYKFSGKQFDPRVVEAFRRVAPADWEKLRAASLRRADDEGRAACGDYQELLPEPFTTDRAAMRKAVPFSRRNLAA